eukprot:TRINITY_DN10980_c0_g1_i1.p1 TRINITY_DN10980_c0_g1~~TRINITY_DN10980_c0_g1_i1.p1  ORF type:complete len:203 (-),score=34.19 TRINITY_DN10980_c0_g1_i1:612-1193(-)
MMENKNSNAGLFSGLSGGLGGPGASGNLQGLSPYLNIDTNYLQSSPEYLFDQETKRGRLEKSFSAIGTAVCVGSGIGGAYGLYDGVRNTANANLTGKMRRTQLLNHTMKGGASSGNALGSVAVLYSLTHTLISLAGYEEDDEAKCLVSGAFTGFIFKSSAGLHKCLRGSAVGLGAAALWAFGFKNNKQIENFM